MLTNVRFQLYLEYHDLIIAREQLNASKSLLGKLYNLLGYFFSFYCLYKMIMASINIIFQRINKMDPISRTLQILLIHFLNVQIDVRFWSQHASFLLVGILVATQGKNNT
jgi:hypothetical protein